MNNEHPIRVTMQNLEFTPGASPFLLGNASFSGIFIINFNHTSNTKGTMEVLLKLFMPICLS